jgi:hypothetical protein
MALAIRFEEQVRSGALASYSALAALGHVTRARVSQIMSLINLAPDIQVAILFLLRTEHGRDPIHLRLLQPIASTIEWKKQRRLWNELLKKTYGASGRRVLREREENRQCLNPLHRRRSTTTSVCAAGAAVTGTSAWSTRAPPTAARWCVAVSAGAAARASLPGNGGSVCEDGSEPPRVGDPQMSSARSQKGPSVGKFVFMSTGVTIFPESAYDCDRSMRAAVT